MNWLRRQFLHPYISALSCFFCFLYIVEIIPFINTELLSIKSDIQFLAHIALQVAAFITLILKPEIGVYTITGITAVEIAISICISTPVPRILTISALSSITFASYFNEIEGIALGAILVLSSTINGLLSTDQDMGNGGFLSYSAFVIVCICIGMQIRQQYRTKLLQQTNQHLADNQMIANNLHDDTANNLSDIILLLSQMQEANIDNTTRKQIDLTKKLASEALSCTRQSIRTLQFDNSETPKRPHRPIHSQDIQQVVDQGKAILNNLGMTGSIIIIGEPQKQTTPHSLTVASNILKELFNNIAKHGDHSSPYTLMVSYTTGFIVIETTNSIHGFQQVSSATPTQSTQMGLTHYRKLIEKCGGIWEKQRTASYWSLHIEIPNDTAIL